MAQVWLRRAWSRSWPAVLGGAGAGVALGGLSYNDEGFKRALHFNRHVLPIALHYKFLEVLNSCGLASCSFEALHQRYAPRSLEIILDQKGFYVKMAQVISQHSDILPKEYIDAYKILRDDAPCMPYDTVRKIVERDLQCSLEDVFQNFAKEPLGAASIGQVHSATLVDGTEVVVKVQYPEAERQFNIDVALFIKTARLLAPYYVDILQQLQKTFSNEFDYRREARLQRQAHDNLRALPDVVVPLPFDDQHPSACKLSALGLVTKNVFVMERLEGTTVDRWSKAAIQSLAAQRQMSVDDVLAELQSLSTQEIQRLVPSEASLRVCAALLRCSDSLRNWVACCYNNTLGWLRSHHVPYKQSAMPVNVHQVVERLFRVQAKCIFQDGFFNGDPHAGNILLLEDGRLGLIDWGQVATLTERERLVLARGVLAVADRDEPLIAELAEEMGLKTKHSNRWVLMKFGLFWLGSFGEDVVGELGGATLFELNLARMDPLVATPSSYFAVVRCLMMTRGVAALIGFPAVDSSVRVRPQAEALLRQANEEFATSPGRKLPRPDLQKLLGASSRSSSNL